MRVQEGEIREGRRKNEVDRIQSIVGYEIPTAQEFERRAMGFRQRTTQRITKQAFVLGVCLDDPVLPQWRHR